MAIRAVRDDEVELLRDIERAAGEAFRDLGMAAIADDEPLAADVLTGYLRAGRAWVATDPADVPVGYLIAEPVDGDLHVEQVSVHPRAARRGVRRALIEHAAAVARAEGRAALTLTTFAAVPWNAPYYQRCGFAVLADHELTPGLRGIRAREAAHGLDRWPRVGMRRPVGSAVPPRPGSVTP